MNVLFFLCFSDNEYGDETSEGGAAFIILNPRNLNGHATIPAPPESRHYISIRTISYSFSYVAVHIFLAGLGHKSNVLCMLPCPNSP